MAGPRTIRGQLIASLVIFEFVVLVFFSALLLEERNTEAQQRMLRRLEYQTSELQVVTRLALRDNNQEMLHTVVGSMLQFPTISWVKVTDPTGRILAATDARLNDTMGLTRWEQERLPEVQALHIFKAPNGTHEAAAPVAGYRQPGSPAITAEGQKNPPPGPVAYIWIYPNEAAARADLRELLRVSTMGTIAIIIASTLLAALMARTLTRPLGRLRAATRLLISNPEDVSAFPLQVTGNNEAADLTIAFNLMVASMEEQRSGLNDTLSLLDSMLANAPIGIAFFDRNTRFIRVNHFLAESDPLGVTHYLGRRVEEVFTPEAALALVPAIERVFEEGVFIQGMEVANLHRPEPGTDADQEPLEPRTWLVNMYPVRTATQTTRWAGVVLIDITQRLRSEQALRDTEKIAAVGRLASSIAHEINNPLEAVTNLLYLLREHGSLGPSETEWAEAAQHEVSRVSEITQQTLRFHRQSTRPVDTKVTELLNSVLTLSQGRIATLQVDVERRFRNAGDLFCFSGELRQLFANLIGNALDAMQPGGGRLVLAVHGSRSWKDESVEGIRVTIADTGCGMSPSVRKHIFEPFYTTKEATGTGLGLWVGAEIMAKHQVVLHIRSRERVPRRAGEPVGHEGEHVQNARSGSVFMLFFPALAVTGGASLQVETAQVVS